MENRIPHPSKFIDEADVTIIRNTAAEAEQMGMLHPEQLRVIYKNKWFKLLVPEVYTGLQITLPNLVRLQEAISWADGSTGWVITLCSGAGWFGGFVSPEIADLFNDSKVCLAGSGAAGGTAAELRSGEAQAHAERGAAKNSGADGCVQAAGFDPGAVPSGQPGDGVCDEDRWEGDSADGDD